VVGRRCPAAGGAAVPPYRIWIVVGRRCPAASGAAAPPYRFGLWWGGGAPPPAERQLRPTDLDCGRAAVPRRRRSGSSALPGVLFVERMAERQFRPTDLDIGGAAMPRRQRSSSSALPGVLFVERMAERQLRPTLPIWILVGRRCPPPAERQFRPTGGFVC